MEWMQVAATIGKLFVHAYKQMRKSPVAASVPGSDNIWGACEPVTVGDERNESWAGERAKASSARERCIISKAVATS